ncbi:MAG: hypothetical protein HN919_15615 [Verrucomicrobia bacterium]|jgi:hypothetical protein|nr:hypothetical protein [Verrucomicrobiota bacterium]
MKCKETELNALAEELNRTICEAAPDVFEMLSGLGGELYFPKGILTQSSEAKEYRVRLLDRHGIGAIATSPTDIRVAFSCIEEENIADLFERMYRCAEEMTKESRD